MTKKNGRWNWHGMGEQCDRTERGVWVFFQDHQVHIKEYLELGLLLVDVYKSAI